MPLLTTAVFLGALPLCIGAGATVVWGRPKRGPYPRGLVVHSLTRRSPIDCSAVAPRTLERGMRLLRDSGHTFVRVADLSRGEQLPPQPVVLTFDDGLEDCHTKALPLLTELGIPATFFPIVGCIGTASAAADVYGTQRYMNARQVRELAGRGHEIGSHGLTHADLALLAPRDLREELRRSKELLEDIIGREVASISFPFGSCNRRVWDTARECGYRAATVYGRSSRCPDALAVLGAYTFDTAGQIAEKLSARSGLHTSFANARIMPHFARGTPLWRFRPSYRLLFTERESR